MRRSLVMIATLIFAPVASAAAQGMMGNPMYPPPGTSEMGHGIITAPGMNSMATVTYDPANHERIVYSLDRETGGFIEGVNTETHKSWRATVRWDGSMTGKDLDGDRWKYDRRARLYTNLATGKTCEKSDLRRVCAP